MLHCALHCWAAAALRMQLSAYVREFGSPVSCARASCLQASHSGSTGVDQRFIDASRCCIDIRLGSSSATYGSLGIKRDDAGRRNVECTFPGDLVSASSQRDSPVLVSWPTLQDAEAAASSTALGQHERQSMHTPSKQSSDSQPAHLGACEALIVIIPIYMVYACICIAGRLHLQNSCRADNSAGWHKSRLPAQK